MNEFQAGKNLLSGHILVMVAARFLMPGGYIPRLEIMERECWKVLDWRLNSDNDSRLHGQPSSSLFLYDIEEED